MKQLKNLYGQLTSSGYYDDNGIYVNDSLTPDQARITSSKLGVPVRCKGQIYAYSGDINQQLDMLYRK